VFLARYRAEKEKKVCPPHQFACANGDCIDMTLVCNKVSDCSDDSDEPAHCNVDECSKVEVHQCGHKCIDTPTSYYCTCNDGYKCVTLGTRPQFLNNCVPQTDINRQFIPC
jgi:low density lipoprotein-related protein 2